MISIDSIGCIYKNKIKKLLSKMSFVTIREERQFLSSVYIKICLISYHGTLCHICLS